MPLDHTSDLARARAEEYKWRTLLGEVVADCVTTRLQDIPTPVLGAVSPSVVVAALLKALESDLAVRSTLERAHRWAVADRETVTPSPDLSYPRPRGADYAGI